MDQTYMKQKPVLPLVVSMALPMTLSMLVNSLYNIVDSIFIAKISDNAMTALSLVYPIQNLIRQSPLALQLEQMLLFPSTLVLEIKKKPTVLPHLAHY